MTTAHEPAGEVDRSEEALEERERLLADYGLIRALPSVNIPTGPARVLGDAAADSGTSGDKSQKANDPTPAAAKPPKKIRSDAGKPRPAKVEQAQGSISEDEAREISTLAQEKEIARVACINAAEDYRIACNEFGALLLRLSARQGKE